MLTCEWHGAQFEVCTGHARALPATQRLTTYETRVKDGRVDLLLPDEKSLRCASSTIAAVPIRA